MSRSTGRIERRRIVLPVALAVEDGRLSLDHHRADALMDTGATISGIAPRWARRLGLVDRGKRVMNFGGGEQQVARYIFRIGLISDDSDALPFFFEVEGFELSDSFSCAALVGMDILERCDLDLRRNGRWALDFGSE